MNGGIEDRGGKGTGPWRIIVSLGRDKDGKYPRHRETMKGTKRDAQRRLREILSSVETGLYVPPSKLTTGQYLQRWVATYAALHTSPRTAQSYEAELRRHIIPAIGNVPLASLRPHHIETYYVEALASGRKDGKGGLSPRTVVYHHRILSEALEHAVRNNELARNPAKMVYPPKAKRAEVTTIAAEDMPKLLEAAANSDYFHLLLAAIYTGARLGELLALKWRNVDLNNATMTIVETLYRAGGTWHLKQPKSTRSCRQVVLPDTLVRYLLEHKTTMQAQREVLDSSLTEDDFVFGQVNGNPRDERSVQRGFERVLKAAGLSHVRFHDLRHTHASLLLKAGVHPKIVSERLGHGSVSFTLDVYSHVMPGLQEAAAGKFELLMQGEK